MSEVFLSGLFVLGVFAMGGTPRRPSARAFVGLLGGVVMGAAIWVFGVSETTMGICILLECIAAGLVVAASIEPTIPEP